MTPYRLHKLILALCFFMTHCPGPSTANIIPVFQDTYIAIGELFLHLVGVFTHHRIFCTVGLIDEPPYVDIPNFDDSKKGDNFHSSSKSIKFDLWSTAPDYAVSFSDSDAPDVINPGAASSTTGKSTDPEGEVEDELDTSSERECTDSDPGGYAVTCSLKNKPGRHCEIFTCQRGGGSCRYDNRRRKCVGRRLTGPTAPAACLSCRCTRDRA